jgi:hypothetical protein
LDFLNELSNPSRNLESGHLAGGRRSTTNLDRDIKYGMDFSIPGDHSRNDHWDSKLRIGKETPREQGAIEKDYIDGSGE